MRRLLAMVSALFLCAFILSCLVFMPLGSAAAENGGKVVRIGWFDSTYCFKDPFGRRSGLAYEYQQRIAAYTGWDYEYIEGTWSELFTMLQNGEIDILCDVSYTSERAQTIRYSRSPMSTESYYIFIKSGNTEMTMEDVSTFNGKVFAINKGSVIESFAKTWADNNGIDYNLLEITDQTVDECFEMLDKGTIDAYLTVESYGDREGCVPVCSIGSSDIYFGVTMDRPDLVKELNSAMAKILNEDPYYNQKLLQKYVWSANTDVHLSAGEITWLSDHGAIRVGYKDDYMPFCSDDNGVLTGALGDYLSKASAIMNNANISFEAYPYATTDDCLKALQNGEIDIAFPLHFNPYEMERMGLVGTEVLINTEVFAVVRPGSTKDIFNDEGVTVALSLNNVNSDNFVKDYYPKWDIKHMSSPDECYKAVSQGKADCAMVNSYRITKNDRLRRRYKLSVLATGHDLNYSFAIRKENKDLYSIINKTIILTDVSETETNLSRYQGYSEKITFGDYIRDNAPSFLALAVGIFVIIILLMLAKFRSDKKAFERQKLINATELDSLTGLYTRNYFFEYAARMHSENPDYQLDAIVLDIEQFHVVNAIYGWEFGDKILKKLSDEIKAYIGENDGIACRTSADIFDIYCLHTNDYPAIYARLQNALEGFSENVNIRIRMGVMPYLAELGPVELFDRARTACNMLKGGGHENLMVFNEAMREREILEQQLLNDLKYAIDNNEFVVFYQPKYNVQADPPVLQSAEALVRWNHHELGMIPPGTFINLFEKHGQIGQIDKYVWREAARQIKEWKDKYGMVIPVSVNLSRVDIFEHDLLHTIDGIIESNGLLRPALHLEVTESAYIDDTEQIIGVVNELRNRGYIIEMDDFGTGYSSLNMLSSMPMDILKLDKSFIDKLLDADSIDEKSVRMVELILDIAKSLNLLVVAEGVENDEQLEFLKAHGCEMVQGYYFSKPVPPKDFEKLAFGENKYAL